MMRWPFVLMTLALPAAAAETTPVAAAPRPVVSEIVAPSGELAVSFVGTVTAKVEAVAPAVPAAPQPQPKSEQPAPAPAQQPAAGQTETK